MANWSAGNAGFVPDNFIHNTTQTGTGGINVMDSLVPVSMTTDSGGIQCSEQYRECEIQRWLWMIASPIILLLGTVGNALIILVMAQKPLRKTAFGTYLIAISVTDLIFIWTSLIRHMIKNYADIDIRKEHVSICWLQRFLSYGSADTSVWLLTAVTLERTLSIYSPTSAMKFKSLTRTKLIIVAVVLIQYGWNLHTFFTTGLEYSEDGNLTAVCGTPNELAKYYYSSSMHNYIVLIDYTLLPFIAMFVMNVAIFIRLRRRDRKYNECATIRNNKATGDHQKTKRSNVSHKTLMLLPVTIFFLVTTLPSIVFTAVDDMLQDKTAEVRAKTELVDLFVSLLMFLNHSMNFFLYCLTGRMFRRKCWEVLSTCCRTKEKTYWEHTRQGCALSGTPIIKKRRFYSSSQSNSTGATPLHTPPQSRTDERGAVSCISQRLMVPTSAN